MPAPRQTPLDQPRTAPATGRPRIRLAPALRRFAREEDGNLIVFGIYVFLIILMFAGIGVDLMHYERNRTSLQNTLDRAVLAAADLDQTLDPETVVRDYLDKAGVGDYLTSVTVDEGLSYRVVSATAKSSMATQFMKLTGVKSLSTPAASTAEERIDGVEISLVLDVSGSMASNNKLTNLKLAAREFVDEMEDNTEDGNLSISIVPYATQVSAPANFLSKFNVSAEHNYSNCVNFQGADFATTTLAPDLAMQRTMHFDPWNRNYDGRAYSPERLVRTPVCSNAAHREMVVLEKNRDTLKTFISNLSAQGNTSIDVGMKWGTALLDPSINPVVIQMIDDGEVSLQFSDRPTTYASGDTIKVIVLMTDGQNTAQYYLPDEYHSGDAGVFWNPEEKVYSVLYGPDVYDRDSDDDTSEDIYYWVGKNVWADHPYGAGTYEKTSTETTCSRYWYGTSWCIEYSTTTTTTTVEEEGTPVALSKADLFAKTTADAIADDIFAPVFGSAKARNDWYNDDTRYTYVDAYTKNARTSAICSAAKAKGIIVFTIGFEAPSSGLAVLKDCASSDSHFFDVEGLEIADAFSSIASSIRKLRLTQ
ncbi:TadE/TadG family type IV pilus assembly protein [Pseudodonghicola flavimaris]|uniref:Pilus assembly protein n=1 Tax=Pseudodonghicola flavimaris TaxID=3050036 RepID=A0ABT7F4F3_9RHOB|nr:TadE/TadG family type IV pilus assembly protein [Pseudodonghicola flavimaris]MDK3019476.1 pilus assembly protein [Pseudodonghicola flavimaris]